jgi:uncharacterized protein (UPF0218 family)
MIKKPSLNVLQLLKKPFGTLVTESKVSEKKISSMIKGAGKVIAVGDATTERLVSFGITPDIAVIDGKERRSRRSYPVSYQDKQVRCTNPAGTISAEALKTLQQALKSEDTVLVIVDGEEDLLALPLFSMSPLGSAVLYGQPLEGMVVVRVTAAKRRRAKELMSMIPKALRKNDDSAS